ncbi:Hypothetical protein PHPALM_3060 [Phytophthora palmivora]|uniref:t-SNARE coiled-coil homology domain-containing protein n=1 Tax=Phytophthora palmivora TaxID=4796 RepID=A0A2P4YNI5_9STRA|nr:Hypothetical protein PHPALM_3060 [Phytophthora palmivora]
MSPPASGSWPQRSLTAHPDAPLHSLVELEQLLRRVKPKYLLPKCYVRTKGSRMSEKDKDELDARLKSIADGAKQMQKKRYQQPFLLSSRLLPEDDRQELDALEQKIVLMRKEEAQKKQVTVVSPKNGDAPNLRSPNSPQSPLLSPLVSPSSPLATSSLLKTATPEIRQRSTPKTRKAVRAAQQTPLFASQNDELEFTEEEDRRFRVENVMLHRHFQENLEDAKKMESKMTEISNLMGQFADKIMEQQTDIELIQQHAQETKSNVTQSNRILEQTQKIGQGYGFMIFCFYLPDSNPRNK